MRQKEQNEWLEKVLIEHRCKRFVDLKLTSEEVALSGAVPSNHDIVRRGEGLDLSLVAICATSSVKMRKSFV
jgi:hypothetical protein